MAKNVPFFVLLVAILALFFFNLQSAAAHNPVNAPVESCDAPAPDSFRITSAGGNFISLSWKPVWPGASYFLAVSEKNNAGQWNSVKVFPDVQDSTFTVGDLEGGKEYRFHISTKCPNNEVSELTAWIDGIALIVDLTLLGRVPKNPVEISGIGIHYPKLHWLGFRVSGEGASGLFEVEVNKNGDFPLAFIRRVNLEDKIVAVLGIKYPIPSNPEINDVDIPFYVKQIQGEQLLEIGQINLVKNSMPPTIDIEVVTPWKPEYQFQVLKADATISSPPGNTGGGQGLQAGQNRFGLELDCPNPFGDLLEVSLLSDELAEEQITLTLFDAENRKIDSINTIGSINTCIFNTTGLPPGLYFLIAEGESTYSVKKLIKAN
jgi:hypothetical protein